MPSIPVSEIKFKASVFHFIIHSPIYGRIALMMAAHT